MLTKHKDTTPLNLSEAKAGLRIAGIAKGGARAVLALNTLLQTKMRLVALKEAIPNLTNTIDLLITISQLHLTRNRSASNRFTEQWPTSGATSFVEWYLHHLQLQPSEIDPTAHKHLFLDVIAVRWLQSAVVRAFGDQLPADLLVRKVQSATQDINGIAHDQSIVLPQPIDDGAATVGYNAWITSIQAHAPSHPLPALFERLKSVTEKPFISAKSRQAEPLPRLNERQLCKSHWYYPRPSELSKLHSFLNGELNSNKESRLRHEAGLIALSISCCQTVQTVLGWTVYERDQDQEGKDRINLATKKSLTSEGTYLGADWCKSEHNIKGSKARVHLPYEVRSWITKLHPGIGNHSLDKLLPFSSEPWDQRAYSCLAKVLSCTTERAEIMTRDLVPRMLYSQTCNSALVNFWRYDASAKIDRADRVALSHYLQPQGERFLNEFALARARALKIDEPRYIDGQVSVKIGSDLFRMEEVQKILNMLEQKISAAIDTISRHNAIACSALFVCILATGHRKSISPFPFPWDFFPCEKLAFICDKLVTGSEARFVALAPTALEYLADYCTHLRSLASNVSIPHNIRNYASEISLLLGFEKESSATAKLIDMTPHAGVFFLQTETGDINRLTTNSLDSLIKKELGIPNAVGRLRTTIAQHLWDSGCSGRSIQAFLGHQPEMHVHGPESTWSVLDVSERVVHSIEIYLQGLRTKPRSSSKEWKPAHHYPNLKTSKHDPKNGIIAPGYEGRERENEWAEQRARAIIRRELSDYLLSSEDSLIAQPEPLDAKVRERIDSRIRSELGSDPIALRKVTAVLEKQIERLRSRAHLKIEIEGRAIQLSTPGPVETGFARSLQHALILRSHWNESVGKPIGHPIFDTIERLAHLAISLACFDAVLSPENISGLVLAAYEQSFESHGELLTLRCNVVTNTHDYEFTVRPGTISTALVLGCVTPKENESIEWHLIEQRIKAILGKLLRLGEPTKWSTTTLCLILRPYWMIRLPGAMYSVSIGEHKGPAADSQAEALIHGSQPPCEIRMLRNRREKSKDSKPDKNKAYDAIKKIFSNARGILERGEGRRRVVRKKLRAGLSSNYAEEALSYGQDTQVVGLLLSFIGRLLESGGPRKSRLAPSTIEKYFSSIAKLLIEHAWDFDFESASPEELKVLFDTIAQKLIPGESELDIRLFCNHLRDELAVPYFSSRWFMTKEPVRIRSGLALPAQIATAITALNRSKNEIDRSAAVFLSFGHGYGLRRLEIFGLSAQQFDEKEALCLFARATQIADLKTHSGRRIICRSFSSESVDQQIKSAVALARTSSRNPAFIFESPTRDDLITKTNPIAWAATEAMRQATGSASVVPHTLRHSFATLLGIALFAPSKESDSQLSQIATSHISNKYTYKVNKILQLPRDWPFGVDAIAVILGHADVSTFLNVYFHGSHLVIADRCEPWQPQQVTQVRLSEMLNKDRPSLSKLSTRLRSKSGSSAFSAVDVVRSLVRRLDTSEPVSTMAVGNMPNSIPNSTRWELLLRALIYRQEQDLSIDGMKGYLIEGLGFSSESANRFATTYERFVFDTSFDDFEPESSSIIKPYPIHRKGIVRGTAEREDFVARAKNWVNSHPSNIEDVKKLVGKWYATVDSDKPSIVCRNQSELEESIRTLISLGARIEHLAIQIHGDMSDSWLAEVTEKYPQTSHSIVRASRGSNRIKVSEVSISVLQSRGGLIPDGRDLHRALVGLYIALDFWHST